MTKSAIVKPLKSASKLLFNTKYTSNVSLILTGRPDRVLIN